MSLVWRDGKALRVNLRSDGHFGVDDGGRQIIQENDLWGSWVTLAIALDGEKIRVRATTDGREWQEIAEFPRKEFAGDPIAVRLGKMNQQSARGDFQTPGPSGTAMIREIRVLGR